MNLKIGMLVRNSNSSSMPQPTYNVCFSAKSVSSVKHLVFKNQIHVNDLLDDPLYAVIFSLIYVISENLSEKDRRVGHGCHLLVCLFVSPI